MRGWPGVELFSLSEGVAWCTTDGAVLLSEGVAWCTTDGAVFSGIPSNDCQFIVDLSALHCTVLPPPPGLGHRA